MALGKVIAIAASTGGVEAVLSVVSRFPATTPPVVVVVHMPIGFTKIYATRLNGKCEATVKEAATGDVLEKGKVLIAPSGKHMKLVNYGGMIKVECFEGDKVNKVIPSADVLFESIADVKKNNAIGVVLTGMGADGAEGLLKMRGKGAKTIGQDRETSAVYGMPKMANEMGALDYVLPLDKIADKILSLI